MPSSGILLYSLLCITDLVDASFLRGRSRGTVAENRALLLRAAVEKGRLRKLPDFAAPDLRTSGQSTLPVPLEAHSPESINNVVNYEVANPTPLPAAYNGAYCRGGACQYRTMPPPPLPPTPIPITPPPIPIGGSAVNSMEFCRGLTCISGMGFPGDPKLATFNMNCVHLYNDIGGGMLGEDASRTIPQAYESFADVCKKRVGILEQGACPTYANTIIGAEAPKVDKTTVGGPAEVCTDTYWFINGFKQAEIDLKLTKAALPKGFGGGSSLLSIALNRFGTGGVGPSSPRGLKWREWVYKHRGWPTPPAMPRQLADDGSFLQMDDLKSDPPKPTKPPLPGADSEEDTPRGLPKYYQNVPCDDKESGAAPQTATKYQIAPGSPDGVVPPVEIDGDLFTYCANQFSEIMMGYAQTAEVTTSMTKSWCAWQSSVSSWIGKQDEYGHPDWDHRSCSNMQMFMSFALRDELADKQSGLSAQQVCKKIFLSIGAVHRTDQIVADAWVPQSTRGAPSGGGVPAADDSGMKDLMRQAQEYANTVFSKMRAQKAAFDSLNGMKMDTAAFDTANDIKVETPPDAPDLPDSDDINPNALIALGVERVRQSKRVGITMSEALSPWGRNEANEAT